MFQLSGVELAVEEIELILVRYPDASGTFVLELVRNRALVLSFGL